MAPALEDKPYNIFFLDCGRKYYSVDSIKKLIDNASAAGFNYIQLAVGNDGLRFLLDDMSLTVNGTTYDSTKVSDAIHAGNEAYYNFDVDELTQREMDTIIDYANQKGMGVIPCVNTPGHMDAILSAANSLTGKTCSYNGSVRTIDVTNDTAVAFTQALLQKYITYFAGKGCKLFNMGADEYANDKYDSGSMGFGNLQYTGKYSYYVQYVNQVAAMIKTAGMNPMAFNDGIYFGNNTSSGTFDKDIIVCYWSNGWPGYTPMPASDLAAKGFKLINTNGSYYWVLGKSDAQCDETKASGFDRTAFPGDSTIKNPLGSMFCIWADYPGAETEESVITKTAATIAAFGKTLPKDEIVISDAANNGGQLETNGTMVLRANKQVDWTTSDASVASIAPSDPETVMAAAETETVNATAITVTAKKAGSATITATAGNKSATYAVTVNDPGTKNVTVTVGGTTEVTVDGNYPGPFTTGDTGIATVQTKVNENDGNVSYKLATLAEGTFYVSTKSGDNAPSVKLTFEDAGSGQYYIKNEDGTYIYPVARFSYNSSFNWSYAINQSKEAVAVTVNSNGTVSISKNYTTRYWGDKDAYLTLSGNSFSATGDKTSLYLYEPVPGDKTYTTDITFKGVSVGTTSVQIGGVTYNINVVKEDLAKVTPLTIEYWITNSRLTGTTTNKDALTIEAASAYSEDGLTVADLVDPEGTKGERTQEYWKNVMLDTQKENSSTSGTELQTEKNGDDETLNGTAFTKVRYWGGKWQVYTTDWVDVNRTQVSVSYQNDKNVTETYSGDRNQLVAYYMEVVDINNANGESELHVNAADWGTKGDGSGDWGYNPEPDRCSVSVQLVYEDSTKNPAKTTADALKSKTIVYGYWAGGRGLGTMVFTGANNYEIYKITAETGDMVSTTSGQTVTVTNFTWDENEEVVWGGDDQTPAASASIGNPAKAPNYTAPYDNLAWNTGSYNNNNAILIRVYVKAKETPDSLHVHYIDATNGRNEEFYSYNINVKQGTTFDNGFALENGALKNNTVTNNVGVTQTVESNLTKMTSIGTQYRYSKFTCIKAERKSEGKDVYLYYTFDDKVSYVVDFGTPVTIQPGDVNDALVATDVELTSVAVAGANHGTVEKSGTTFTYTPDSRFVSSQEGETLTVTYTGNLKTDTGIQNGSKAYQVYIYPASNVLYEENFLTGAEGWTDASVEHTTAQETQKAKEDKKNVFGYDGSYARATNNNGVWEATGLNTSALTKPLTTNFYGNTFDLIGNCAPDSGRVIMVIKGDDGKGRAVDVDTRYSSGTIYQVPLAHVVMGDTDKNYSVMIYASGLASKTDTDAAPRGVATMSIDDANIEADDLLAQVLEENGLSMDDVEYVSVSAMDNANVVTADDSDDAVAIYANDAKATAYQSGTHVEIDGFRVYRSTNDDVASNYPTNEKNVDYKRILDVVKGEITAYSDNNGQLKIDVQQYEANGGPQNEIYLVKGQSVFFQSNDLANKEVQVSLRAVNANATASVAGTQISLASNTEMYYTLKADETGKVTIVNNGTGLLAIGNVKLPKSVTTDSIQSASEAGDEAVITALKSVLYTDEEPEVFTPETFTAKTTVTPVVRNKMVTLKVNVSSDVAYITVNGVKYTRTGLQGLFRKTRTIRVVNTVKKGQTKTYEVVAYNADGVASETITATG